jgi:hypothetical protein
MNTKIKILQKKMTRQELLSYIESHPKWRCPNKDEVHEVLDILEDKTSFRLSNFDYNSMALPLKGEIVHISELIKVDIVLIQKLASCVDTGTILYVEFDNADELRRTGRLYDRPYSKLELIESNSLGVFDELIESMTDKDYIVFKQTVKTMRVVIKETLEKVVEIDYSAKLDKNDILSHVEEIYLDNKIELKESDYNGDYSIAECLNCNKNALVDYVSIDEEYNTEVTKVLK